MKIDNGDIKGRGRLHACKKLEKNGLQRRNDCLKHDIHYILMELINVRKPIWDVTEVAHTGLGCLST